MTHAIHSHPATGKAAQSDLRPDPRLAARVPRYTSYPPANHFSEAVDASTVRTWLGELDPARPVSLYVHVPFCRRLCWFCACRTQGTKTAAPVDGYLDHLIQEIALVRSALPDGIEVAHLHWGGGTPTLMTPAQTERLGKALTRSFPMTEDAEFAVEIDPTELDDARLDALVDLGLGRASIGVQDFEPRIQAAIGREQGADTTRRAIDGLRARGVRSLNIDLLYGLPFQTEDSLAKTLRTVIELGPDRLALYGYAHVPWMAKRQRLVPEDRLPGPAERLRLAGTARRQLVEAGYVPVGIDHFAKPGDSMARALETGTLRRNFQGYTTDPAETLIGLGASAVSRYPQGFAQNAVRTGDWARCVAGGRLATARGHALDAADRLRNRVIEQMMCRFATDTGAAARALDMPEATLDDALHRALALYPDAVVCDGRRLALTHDDGRYARVVASVFDAYMEPASQTYSLAL